MAMWRDEPEPGHHNNSGHHEETEEESKSMQILALVTGVVAASIFFEKLKDYIEESVESEELKPIVRHLFGELTVLGFIGLVIFILDKTGIPKEWTEKTEQIHMVIFVVSLVFLTVVMILVKMGKRMAASWRDAEDVIIDPIHDRITLIDEYLFRRNSAKGHFGVFGQLSADVKAYQRAHFQLEYHGLRDSFLECQSKCFPGTKTPIPKVATLHHGVSASEAKRLAKLLVADFNLADYLNTCMAEALTEIVEIQATTWFALYLVFIPFWVVLDRFDTPQEAIYAFLALPYCMLIALFIIKKKLHYIRSQLQPGFMHEATRLVDLTSDGVRKKSKGSRELESAPLLGSLNNDDTNSLIPIGNRARTESESSLHPLMAGQEMGSRRRRQSQVEPPATQNLQFITMQQAGKLKSFIVESNFEFADPETIPYLRQKESSLHQGSGGFTKWMHGMGGKHAQGERHSHTASAHEQLFWFSRNGSHFLLHLIRIIMMLIGIYIAVISTAIMPALWRHKVNETSDEGDCLPYEHHEEGLGNSFGPYGYGEEPEPEAKEYCFTFAFQVVYSVIGFFPIFLIIPQFYYIIHNFVIVTNVGMMREPKIVAKVFRSGRTRKSLRVLKLLSSMKQGASNRTSSPSPTGGKSSKKPSKRIHEMQEAAKVAFELMDDDNSRSISHVELRALLGKLNLNMSEQELQNTVHELDDDNSGEISEDEFMEWIKKVNENAALDLTDPEVIEEFVDIIFAAIDVDGDGNVTTQELFDCLNSLGQNLKYDEVQDIMADIDKDNSGSVDKEEFLHMIKEHAAFL